MSATTDSLRVSSDGLNLSDPEDRALYRGRVREAFRYCRVSAIADYAIAAGAPTANHNVRAAAVRALADAWMATS